MRRPTALGAALAMVAATAVLAAPAQAAPPSGDDFADALEVSAFPAHLSIDTTDAGLETDEPQPSCAPIGSTVWLRLESATADEVIIDTAGSGFDTVVAVHHGSGLADLEEVDCADSDGGSEHARVYLDLAAGEVLWAQVGGYLDRKGSLEISVTGTDPLAPAHDDFDRALVVDHLPFEHSVDLAHASVERYEGTRHCGLTMGHTVWYRLPDVGGQTIDLTVAAPSAETVMAVHREGQSGRVTVGCAGGTPDRSGVVTVEHDGSAHWLQVGGLGDAADVITVTMAGLSPAPNDDRADAIELGPAGSVVDTDLRGAQASPEDPPCAPIPLFSRSELSNTVWFRLERSVPESVLLTASADDERTLPVVSVHRFDGSVLESEGCSSTTASDAQTTHLSFVARPGTTYWVQVGVDERSDPGRVRLKVDRGAAAGAAAAGTRATVSEDGSRSRTWAAGARVCLGLGCSD